MLFVYTGHKRAWEDARVLHRDVSVGNILITDEPTNEPNSTGFLHDFDYSSIEHEPENGGPDDVRQAERTVSTTSYHTICHGG